jgi:hypothetical protein
MTTLTSQSGHYGERLVYLSVVVIIAVGLIAAAVAPDFLEDPYLIEDGILEWLSVILLLVLSGLCLKRAIRLRSVRPGTFAISLGLMALGFFFVAGEELSWGQRVFMIETPDWLADRNQQGETNLHNLVLGDMSVNEVIFGNLLTLLLFFYMFPLPWLAGKVPAVDGLVTRFGIPLPNWVQSFAFLLAVGLPVVLFASAKADEMSEACGLLVLMAIFLWPRNGHIYAPGPRVSRPG